jgi:hypothetical protein
MCVTLEKDKKEKEEESGKNLPFAVLLFYCFCTEATLFRACENDRASVLRVLLCKVSVRVTPHSLGMWGQPKRVAHVAPAHKPARGCASTSSRRRLRISGPSKLTTFDGEKIGTLPILPLATGSTASVADPMRLCLAVHPPHRSSNS